MFKASIWVNCRFTINRREGSNDFNRYTKHSFVKSLMRLDERRTL